MRVAGVCGGVICVGGRASSPYIIYQPKEIRLAKVRKNGVNEVGGGRKTTRSTSCRRGKSGGK